MTRVIDQTEAERLLARIDVHQAMRAMFAKPAEGRAVQPAQQLVESPAAATSSITWACWLDEGVYGIKTSPYIPARRAPP